MTTKGGSRAGVISRVVSYGKFAQALEMISRVHNLARDQLGVGAFLLGEPGVGKTTCIREYERQFNSANTPLEDSKPIIRIEFTKRTSVNSMLRAFIVAMGGEPHSRATEDQLLFQCARLIANLKVSLVFIDEAQNLISGRSGSDPAGVFDTLKSLMNNSNISIVMSGLPVVNEVFNHLPSQQRDLKRRFKHSIELTAFSMGCPDDFKRFAEGILKETELDEELMDNGVFLTALMLASKGNQYEFVSLVLQAIEERASNSKFITNACFDRAYKSFSSDKSPFKMTREEIKAGLAQIETLRPKNGS